jgi:hypothetical protein
VPSALFPTVWLATHLTVFSANRVSTSTRQSAAVVLLFFRVVYSVTLRPVTAVSQASTLYQILAVNVLFKVVQSATTLTLHSVLHAPLITSSAVVLAVSVLLY